MANRRPIRLCHPSVGVPATVRGRGRTTETWLSKAGVFFATVLRAYRYMLGSRSAVEWIIDGYRVKTDKPSGIVNYPNDWLRDVPGPGTSSTCSPATSR
jgi:hypothetical protein